MNCKSKLAPCRVETDALNSDPLIYGLFVLRIPRSQEDSMKILSTITQHPLQKIASYFAAAGPLSLHCHSSLNDLQIMLAIAHVCSMVFAILTICACNLPSKISNHKIIAGTSSFGVQHTIGTPACTRVLSWCHHERSSVDVPDVSR